MNNKQLLNRAIGDAQASRGNATLAAADTKKSAKYAVCAASRACETAHDARDLQAEVANANRS